MKKPYIPFAAFLMLWLLTIPFSSDLESSAIPGWHTTIYPLRYIWELIIAIILLLATIGYWLLSKRVAKVNWIMDVVFLP